MTGVETLTSTNRARLRGGGGRRRPSSGASEWNPRHLGGSLGLWLMGPRPGSKTRVGSKTSALPHLWDALPLNGPPQLTLGPYAFLPLASPGRGPAGLQAQCSVPLGGWLPAPRAFFLGGSGTWRARSWMHCSTQGPHTQQVLSNTLCFAVAPPAARVS